ncbi:MAG TPA: DNA polymerase Y family protein, partial [Acetobacteraceae bacterium]|nr:DNA polymerase Y family protein [Acetobacteraceae bacterium]
MEQTLWLAIALPGWPIRRLIKDGLASPDQAFATVTSHAGQRRLETLSSRAAQAGLKVGQSLSQARAILPGLLSFPATPAEDAQALTRLGLWCQAYSPLVAVEPPDMILLDMTGALHLHGTRQALLAGLAARLPGAQLALAGNAARARAFARFGVSEPVDEVAALAALPLASLGLNERVEAALRRLGVRRVGQFMRLDRGELTARFGTAPVRLLDQAMGRLTEILRFLSAPPDWRESRHYPEPLLHAEALLHALGVLAHILCTRLGEAGLGLRLLQAQFFRADAQMVTFDIGFAAAMRDEIRLARLMAGKIETI